MDHLILEQLKNLMGEMSFLGITIAGILAVIAIALIVGLVHFW